MKRELVSFHIEGFFVTVDHEKRPPEACSVSQISERKCSLCTLNDIGDEFHYVLKCPYFHTDRQIYLKSYYTQRPNMLKFGELLKTNSESVLTKLSKFTHIILQAFN